MKWEDVIQACKNLGYTPEEILKIMQVHERSVSYAERFRKPEHEKSTNKKGLYVI